MSNYAAVIARREAALLARPAGVEPKPMGGHLFAFQADATTWALRRGRAAIFAATGLGKTLMELEWAQQIGGTVLLLAPLAVGPQIAREAARFGVSDVRTVREPGEIRAGVNITNYDRLHHFWPDGLDGLILDESSILKSFDGKTRRELTEFGAQVPMRLCATATPAPNDYEELGQHAEFLGVLTSREMLALYFTQDGNTTTKWRLKGHARQPFWRWVASWALAITGPADLGHPEEQKRFELPPLSVRPVVVKTANEHVLGTLFADEARTLQERREARRNTLDERVAATASLVAAEPDEQWLLWCDLNAESEALTKAIPGAVEVRGSDSPEWKVAVVEWFQGHRCLCDRADFRSKLSGWLTTRSTSDATTPRTASADLLSQAPTSGNTPTNDGRTCVSTTSTIPTSSPDARPSSRPNTTADGGSSTQLIQSCVPKPEHRFESGRPPTQRNALRSDSSDLASRPTSTEPLSSHRAAGVPSAVDPTTTQGVDSMSTIATPEDIHEASSARRAISDSESSATIPTALNVPRCICGHIDGRRILVSKPSIFGHGLNLQGCARMAFVGLSDSFERYHQAVRRCWRFGQTREVIAWVVTADAEGAVVRNIQRKERQMTEMMAELVANVGRTGEHVATRTVAERDDAEGPGWRLMLGDCVERVAEIEAESVGLSVFSPPFPSMYVYTDDPRDMGNVADVETMIEQFGYLVPELLRVLMPGRSVAIHLAQAQTRKRDGQEIGLRDFRGATIDAMTRGGFTFYGEATIDKDPQVKAVRTKDRGLLFKSLAGDSAMMRMAQADYLLQFRKPGENPRPVRAGISEKYGNPDGWITPEEWIEWAAPVWYRAGDGYPGGIRETDTLNVAIARDGKDERHLCPLQLGVIERAVKLWSAPGDLVLSPFAGVGSEGVGALRLGREFVGVELKRSYYETARANLALAVGEAAQPSLLAGSGA